MEYAGSVSSIADALNALGAARLDWCKNDKVYTTLGKARAHLIAARDMARAIEAQSKGKP